MKGHRSGLRLPSLSDAAVVVTAKAHSSRLRGKNMLPLGGVPLAFHSVAEARAASRNALVVTDIPALAEHASSVGCRVVPHPSGLTHQGVIEKGLSDAGFDGFPVVLLQPTSPFRHGGIVRKCWRRFAETGKTVITTAVMHDARVYGGEMINHKNHAVFWDGCVAVFPPGQVCGFSDVETVRNLPVNSLQIDTEEDYVMACATAETFRPLRHSVSESIAWMVRSVLAQNGIAGSLTVVCRGGESPVPQDGPVAYVNHCQGYDGGRCDVLFVIANPALASRGINDDLRECAAKAKVVIVRDNGTLGWLAQSLPEMTGKFLPIRFAIDKADDHLTSGAIFCDLMTVCGLTVSVIGMYAPGEIESVLLPYHRPGMSREIALLHDSGVI